MKQCPRCHRNIPDDAKVCPYCGLPLVPIERNKKTPNKYLIIALSFLLFFSPIITMFFYGSILNEGEDTTTTVTNEKNVVLGQLGDVKNTQETVKHSYDSINSLDNGVSDVSSYCKNLRGYETKLKAIIKKYDASITESSYQFDVTDINDIYADISYYVTSSNNTDYLITLSYDLSGLTNEFTITKTTKKLKDFKAIKKNDLKLLNEIVKLYDSSKDTSLIKNIVNKVNDNEKEFDQRKNNLGHYGFGYTKIKDDKTVAYHLLGTKNNYSSRLKYISKLNIKSLVD